MNLKKYITELTDFANKNPECLEMEVVGATYSGITEQPKKGKLKRRMTSFNFFDEDSDECDAVCVG